MDEKTRQDKRIAELEAENAELKKRLECKDRLLKKLIFDIQSECSSDESLFYLMAAQALDAMKKP